MLTNKRRLTLLAVVAALTIVVSTLIYLNEEIPGSSHQMARKFAKNVNTMLQSSFPGVIDDSDNPPKMIRIMYATSAFRSPHWGWGIGSTPLQICPHFIGRCEFTRELSLANESHALLFHIQRLRSEHVPAYRSPHQKWIFANRESPVSCVWKLKRVKIFFNLTMSYTHATEYNVHWSYGSCFPTPGRSGNINYVRGKKHLVAWFVSNCKTSSRREKYVEEMQKHADIHIYGCGPYKCPKSKGDYCYDELLNNDYKFYLSFENSLCKDYITEKLWRVMSVNIVPIVLGHANYSHWLPAHSYIDVRDFASPKHLVHYLELLDRNDTLYNEYFRWKSRFRCDFRNRNNACELCRYLLESYGQQQNVGEVHNFWDPTKHCLEPSNFYKSLGVELAERQLKQTEE